MLLMNRTSEGGWTCLGGLFFRVFVVERRRKRIQILLSNNLCKSSEKDLADTLLICLGRTPFLRILLKRGSRFRFHQRDIGTVDESVHVQIFTEVNIGHGI